MQITGGFLNSRKIKTLKADNVKPTLSKARQGIFNSLISVFGDFSDKIFLDLFAGSAIMSFEAVSRGFKEVITVENDKKTAKIIRTNFEDFKIQPNLFVIDALRFLKKTDKKFDLIFVDPPYESSLYDSALQIIREKQLLNNGGIIVMEHKNDKMINVNGFNIIKTKDYSDIRITFLESSEI